MGSKIILEEVKSKLVGVSDSEWEMVEAGTKDLEVAGAAGIRFKPDLKYQKVLHRVWKESRICLGLEC